MNELQEYENQFKEEVLDLLILTKTSTNGGAVVGDYVRPGVYFVAAVNLQTGELSHETGLLSWMVERKRKDWGYEFHQFEIYHIQARKSIPIVLKPDNPTIWNSRYLLLKVVKETVSEPRLDAIREHLKKPIIISDAIGTFELNRQFSCFEGTIDWLGEQCDVCLETNEEDGDTMEKAMHTLHMLYTDLTGWDARLRAYAAAKMTEDANDWLQDSLEEEENFVPITEEDFAKRMGISMIAIRPDGDITVYYDDDDMFWGHTIVVYTNKNGEMTDADIAG